MASNKNKQVVSQESYSSNVVSLPDRRVEERRKPYGSNWHGNDWLTDEGVAKTLDLEPRDQYLRLAALLPQYLDDKLDVYERAVLRFNLALLMFVNGKTTGTIRWEQARDGHKESNGLQRVSGVGFRSHVAWERARRTLNGSGFITEAKIKTSESFNKQTEFSINVEKILRTMQAIERTPDLVALSVAPKKAVPQRAKKTKNPLEHNAEDSVSLKIPKKFSNKNNDLDEKVDMMLNVITYDVKHHSIGCQTATYIEEGKEEGKEEKPLAAGAASSEVEVKPSPREIALQSVATGKSKSSAGRAKKASKAEVSRNRTTVDAVWREVCTEVYPGVTPSYVDGKDAAIFTNKFDARGMQGGMRDFLYVVVHKWALHASPTGEFKKWHDKDREVKISPTPNFHHLTQFFGWFSTWYVNEQARGARPAHLVQEHQEKVAVASSAQKEVARLRKELEDSEKFGDEVSKELEELRREIQQLKNKVCK